MPWEDFWGPKGKARLWVVAMSDGDVGRSLEGMGPSGDDVAGREWLGAGVAEVKAIDRN